MLDWQDDYQKKKKKNSPKHIIFEKNPIPISHLPLNNLSKWFKSEFVS